MVDKTPEASSTPAVPALQPTRSRSHSRSGRHTSSRALFATSGAPASSAHDLPSSSALADLNLTRASSRNSQKEYAYRGGGGLGRVESGASAMGGAGKIVVGREGKILEDHDEESREGGVVDEEAGVGGGGEVIVETDEHAQKMYDRFSERRKTLIVVTVAFAAVLAPFSSASFLPSIPAIVKDLNTSATVINISIAIFILVIGVTPLIWAPYSGVYGRRPIYLISLPIYTLGSLGVALSPTLTSLIITRIIQGAGSSAVLSVGAGTIGDLYPREHRGQAMGLFYSGILVGPAIAPAIGGVLTEYVYEGWRAMQWLLFAMGACASVLVYFALPETSHARGIDLIRAERAEHLEEENRERKERGEEVDEVAPPRGWWQRWTADAVVVWINPLAPLKLLAQPHILAMSLNSSFVLMSTYTILVPLGETLAPRYNITNSAILGCFYLAQGAGNLLASRFTGTFADYTLALWLKKRGGVYVAEDRLKATLIGGGILLPGAVLALGWTLEKASGKGGLAGAIILLFVDGIALMMVLTPANTYCVDVMQHRSAEVIAVNNCVRYTVSAAASAFVLPMIQAIGVGLTNTFAAIIVWLGFALVCVTIRYGPQMRAWGERFEDAGSEAGDDEKGSPVATVARSEATLVQTHSMSVTEPPEGEGGEKGKPQ